ncbi:hypothetical protein ACV566_03715 [Staphylococcus aureus]
MLIQLEHLNTSVWHYTHKSNKYLQQVKWSTEKDGGILINETIS